MSAFSTIVLINPGDQIARQAGVVNFSVCFTEENVNVLKPFHCAERPRIWAAVPSRSLGPDTSVRKNQPAYAPLRHGIQPSPCGAPSEGWLPR